MKRVIVLIFIINQWHSVLFAQSLDQTFRFGEQMYAEKAWTSAMEAYKRTMFFDSLQTYSKIIYPKIAQSFYELNKYVEASEYYDLAYYSETNDSLKQTYLLKKASCQLVLKQYQFAQIELLNLDDHIPASLKNEKVFLEAMTHFSLAEFDESKLSFKKIIADSSVVNQLFAKNLKIEKINPRKARIMSMIVPGLGQLYAGDIKNGLNSMILTGGLFAIGIRSGLINGPLDASISVLPWFQRYYQGGFKKAEAIAIAKKEEKRYEVFNQLLNEVEKNKKL